MQLQLKWTLWYLFTKRIHMYGNTNKMNYPPETLKTGAEKIKTWYSSKYSQILIIKNKFMLYTFTLTIKKYYNFIILKNLNTN